MLLLDVVIGFGAQDDPAASLAAEVANVRGARRAHPLAAIATVTGTKQRSRQIATLQEAGIAVMPSLPAARAGASADYPHLTRTERERPVLLDGVAVINAGLRSSPMTCKPATFRWCITSGRRWPVAIND